VPSVQASNASMPRRRWWHLCTLPWVAVLLRVLLGGVFVFAGFSKLLLPHAEVVAHIQQYQVLPGWLVSITAMFLPWIEIGSGTALLVGFCTTPAAMLIALQLLTFSALMAIVLAAGIPIEDCGCFGNLGLPETPLQVLIRDLIMLALLLPIIYRQGDALGLDAWSSAPASSEV
jgi:putative oxidoreductase